MYRATRVDVGRYQKNRLAQFHTALSQKLKGKNRKELKKSRVFREFLVLPRKNKGKVLIVESFFFVVVLCAPVDRIWFETEFS